MAARLSYTPEPHEQAHYDRLFATADVQRAGAIGGAEAVQFFSRSKLPVDALKSIWTLADQPTTNSLDKPKFYVAVRLIQLQQNNERGNGPTLAAPPGKTLRPVFFEGIPPPPPAPQQQQQAPPSPAAPPASPMRPDHPPRPPMQQQQVPSQRSMSGSTAGASSSMALTAQDPYTLTPTEQSRYEGIFAEYAKPDGYVYGAEAVELFGKSGTPQPTLAAIWNLCDQPVDNRLDKMEFCLAMHLIVCVSKKNLPLPPVLPMSLKQLKSQQSAASAMMAGATAGSVDGMPSSPMQQGQVPQQQPMQQLNLSAPPSPGSGMMQQQQIQQPQLSPGGPPPIQPSPSGLSSLGGPPPLQQQQQPQMGAPPGPSGLAGPPPLQQQGGLSISDAFEGLSTDQSGAGGAQQYMASTPPPPVQPASVPTSVTIEPASMGIPEPVMSSNEPAPAPVVTMSYSQEAAPKSTEQLASSYDMGSAHDELDKLKATLQKLQAENISLKAQVGSLNEDEKDVQKQIAATVHEIGELSNELTTLRAQVLSAKSRLMEATAELKALEERKGVMTGLITEARATKDAMETAADSLEEATEVARAAPSPVAPAPSNAFEGDLFGFDAAPPAPAPGPAPGYGVPSPVPSQDFQQPPPVDQQQSAPAPVVVQSPSYDSAPAPAQPASYGSAPTPPPAYDSAPAPAQPPAYDAYGARPEAVQGHNRAASTVSVGFDAGDIMGGAPGPLPGAGPIPAAEPSAYGGAGATPTIENVEELKKQAREASSIAQDAEETRRHLAAQVDELRRVADEAEAAARKNTEAAEAKGQKKRGLMRRGGHTKKDQKETERLNADAKTKKEKFLEAQSQANDAQSVAMETKREAERLRRAAEEAEVQAASAASIQHAPPPQPTNGYPTQTESIPQPDKGPPPSYGGGFQGQQQADGPYGGSFQGQMPAYGGGMQSQPTPPVSGEFGGAPGGPPAPDAYNPNVMGGGGLSIPTPSGAEDPYSNPFG